MSLLDLVRPLEDPWQEVVDAVLRKRGAPTTREPDRLGARVAELSAAYNAGRAGEGVRVPLEARIGFSFARDVPKGAAAVRELVAARALAPRGEGDALRVVDLGAGLGAMSWGVARAARACGVRRVDALFVDDDREALSAAEAIAREAASRLGESEPRVDVRTRVERIAPQMKLPEADVVILGQVLSELDLSLEPRERVARHATLARDLLSRVVAPHGSLVIVEPALRDRTRHLHAVRDALVEEATVFGPCLHAQRCPALLTEGEWCHEDLAVDLPPWLVPLARAAGLRWQGLTSSVLVLRRDGARLGDLGAGERQGDDGGKVRLRVVSDLIATKGKAELFACTAAGERRRLRRLDRDGAGAANGSSWHDLRRGDVVTLTGRGAPPIDDRGRVSATVEIDVWPVRK
ncbi:MAG: hypothetical protein KF819_30760 [Labilithrix sp.]|nr:hypothetical protein [Labilithrix sp.]